MKQSKKSKQAKRALAYIKAQRALSRAEFFAAGGELCRVRGLRLIQQDKKKRANKRACRGKVRM
jgi:hypothetical protein